MTLKYQALKENTLLLIITDLRLTHLMQKKKSQKELVNESKSTIKSIAR